MTKKLLTNDQVVMGEASSVLPKPATAYIDTMDELLFLREDCSYRCDPVDRQFLSILWHPEEDRLVGIKIGGYKWICSRLMCILCTDDHAAVPLVSVIELMSALVMLGPFTHQGTILLKDHLRAKQLIGQSLEFVSGVWIRLCDGAIVENASYAWCRKSPYKGIRAVEEIERYAAAVEASDAKKK